MKRKLAMAIVATYMQFSYAQAPQGINYQAVIRDEGGKEVVNTPIGLQIQLRQGDARGNVVYAENFSPTTNELGLINLVIGQGNTTQGKFDEIDWAHGPYFAQLDIDLAGGNNYTTLGTQQLMSVPYALYAEKCGAHSENPTRGGTTTSGHYVGEYAYGGIIFYVEPDGTHGLVATLQDQSAGIPMIDINNDCQYNAYNSSWIYYRFWNNKDGIYGGRENTERLNHSHCAIPGNYAANLADIYTYGGYGDWYIPSKMELDLLYENLHLNGLGGFSTTVAYWSSTGNWYTWFKNFGTGYSGQAQGYTNLRVRLIRVF